MGVNLESALGIWHKPYPYQHPSTYKNLEKNFFIKENAFENINCDMTDHFAQGKLS